MIQSILKLIEMLILENIIPGEYQRIPESASMEGPDQVVAWHMLGADDGPIMAVYYFVARHSSYWDRFVRVDGNSRKSRS